MVWLVLSVLLLLLPAALQAQEKDRLHSVEVSWGASVPVSDVFLNGGVGLSALSLHYEYRVYPCLGVGMRVGYDSQSKSGYTLDNLWSGTLTTTGYSSRSQTSLPLMLTARWYPTGERKGLFRPYVGTGIGATWTKRELTGEMINTMRHATWGVSVMPEIGTRICLLSFLFVDVECSYRYCSSGWDAVGLDATHGLYPTIGVGMEF